MHQFRVRKQEDEEVEHWEFIYSLTTEFKRTWSNAFDGYANELRRVPLATLEHGVETDDFNRVVGEVPFDEADEALRNGWITLIAITAGRAAIAELARLEVPVEFDNASPFARRFVQQNTAELVRQVTEESRQAIREIIMDAFVQGDSPQAVAPRIQQVIGLTARDSKAVLRYWRSLVGEGVPVGRAGKLADEYAKRLLKTRALTIAETEIVAAANGGQQLAYLQARDRGALPWDARRQWVALLERNTCQVCLALDGKSVGLSESFFDAVYGGRYLTPPAHPRCRCTIRLKVV